MVWFCGDIILNEGDKRKVALEIRAKKTVFESYGFYEFLKRKQFEIIE